jgi:hypothetical protein
MGKWRRLYAVLFCDSVLYAPEISHLYFFIWNALFIVNSSIWLVLYIDSILSIERQNFWQIHIFTSSVVTCSKLQDPSTVVAFMTNMLVNRMHGTDYQDCVVPRFRIPALYFRSRIFSTALCFRMLSLFRTRYRRVNRHWITKFTIGDFRSVSRNKACSKVRRGPAWLHFRQPQFQMYLLFSTMLV